jgi:predicted amidohydrolase
MRSFHAAAVSMCATGDPAASLAAALAQVDAAIEAGAQLVVLPEGYAGIGAASLRAQVAFRMEDAETAPALKPLCARSRDHGVTIVAGGVPECAPTGHPFNTLVLIEGGAVTAHYRKVHLFDARVPGVPSAGESSMASAGDEVLVFATALAKLGPSICYDLRFAELYRAQMRAGAEVLLVPAAFTLRTGMAHWETLLRARAIENQAFVVAPAQYGVHGPGRESFGHSMIIDPWGTVLACHAEGDGVALARLDADVLRGVRARLPVQTGARLAPDAEARVITTTGAPEA